MAKVIIGIHGLGNKPPKKLLKEWWRTSIYEGFAKQGLTVPKFKFEMVYWADIIYNYPENPNITDKDDPYYLKYPYMPSPWEAREIKDYSFRKKVLRFIEHQLDKVFLNADLSLNYSQVTDAIMYKYFMELEMYYGASGSQIKLKQKTRSRLKKLIEKYKYDDILLVSHSMGTFIAYDVLQFELKDINIHTFITMGSALGLPFIKAKIAKEMKMANPDKKISTPECVSSAWFNFADLEDRIALNFDLNNDFSSNSKGIQVIDYEVINDYEINGESNPHKCYGYLRSKEFILNLNSFLTDKKEFTISNLVNGIRKIGHQIIHTNILKSNT